MKFKSGDILQHKDFKREFTVVRSVQNEEYSVTDIHNPVTGTFSKTYIEHYYFKINKLNSKIYSILYKGIQYDS